MSEKHFYDFDRFRIDAGERVLMRDGEIMSMTQKAFDVLFLLVERRDRIVTKEELMNEVWPDTFVEEGNLSQNIYTLRKILGQTADGDDYIKTVPRRGYRFAAPVNETWGGENARDIPTGELRLMVDQKREKLRDLFELSKEVGVAENAPPNLVVEEEIVVEPPAKVEPTEPADWPASPNVGEGTRLPKAITVTPTRLRPWLASRWLRPIAFCALALIVSTAGWWYLLRPISQLPASPLRIIPLTSFPGSKIQPAFSPDANQVAFVWDGERGDNFDIYVKLIEAGGPLRLTTHHGDDYSPAWSPDGSQIAFLRRFAGSSGIYLVPSLGGTERKLSEVNPSRGDWGLDWSPDGRLVAVADKSSPGDPFSIHLISVESGERRRLTSPSQYLHDTLPTFSPDGKTLAFIRGASILISDIYLVPTSGGEPKRLTFDHQMLVGLAWTADSREIVFSSNRGGLFSLWRVSASGGTPEPLPAVGGDAYFPAISRRGGRLAYVRYGADLNIWRTVGPSAPAQDGSPVKLISSTRRDFLPQFSPDGRRIAFTSSRSGSEEIWSCDSEGLNPLQLTSLGRPETGTPRWSPDGRHITFDCRLDAHADIFVISAEGGQPRRLTTEPAEDAVSSWSRDGRWIYFFSNRSGSGQVWKVPAAGGQAVEITKHGGFEAFESPDGKLVYYHKSGGIWRVPVGGGEEIRILDQVDWGDWAVLDQGICYLNRRATPRPRIEFFNFATRQVKQVTTIETEPRLPNPLWGPVDAPGFAVTPDGRWIIYTHLDQIDNDIMLVENFR